VQLQSTQIIAVGIASLALVFSIVSFTLSYLRGQRSSIRDVKPVLAFEYNGNVGWILRNIGNGPALNVVVAQKRVGGNWFNPVRVPPLAADSSFVPTWLGHVNTTGLGATYMDIDGKKYSSVTGNDLTKIHGHEVFGPWDEAEIGLHWKQPPYRED